MILKHNGTWTLYGPGIRPTDCSSSDKPYHLCKGDEHYDFDIVKEARDEYSNKTGESSFVLGKTTW